MIQAILVVCLLFFQDVTLFLKPPKSSLNKCKIFDEEYKIILRHYTRISYWTHIKIIRHSNEQKQYIIEQFTENTIKLLNNSVLFGKPKNNGSAQAYVIIAWDVRAAMENSKRIIAKARDYHFFQFVAPSVENFQILEYFWVHFGAPNVIAQAPCTNQDDTVSIYRPFIKINNSWGIIETFSIREILKNFNILDNPLTNLNNYSLNISMFVRIPNVVSDIPRLLRFNSIYKNLTSSFGFVGSGAVLLTCLTERLNFQAVRLTEKSSQNFGGILPNGTLYGSYKDIAMGRATFGINSRYLIPQYTEYADLTFPIEQSNICAVVNKSPQLPKFLNILQSFDNTSIILISITFLSSAFFWFFLLWKIIPSIELSFYYLIGISSNIATNSFFYMISCLVFNNVIVALIVGNFFAILTTIGYEKDIDTIEELIKLNKPIASYIWDYISPEAWSDLFKLKSRIFDQSYTLDDFYDALVYNHSVSVIDVKKGIDMQMKVRHVGNNGEPVLHLVDECLTVILCGLLVHKGSPLIDPINNIIGKLRGNGLFKKWELDVMDSLISEKMMNLTKNARNDEILKLYDLRSSFYLLISGWIISASTLIFEILDNRCKMQKILVSN